VRQYSRPVCRPFTQPYDRAELIADGLMHAAGIGLAVPGVIHLTSVASRLPDLSASVWIYAVGLVGMLAMSAAYNISPMCRGKLLLRRFDQATIYLFIAATYTPFISQTRQGGLKTLLLALVWAAAGTGAALKLAFPGRLERFGILLCFALGWGGLLAYDVMFSALPASTIGLVVTGGVLYSIGVMFHLWDGLRFQNAIWHAFVLVAAALQFFAVFNSVSVAASAG
jgi:hemolysin III